MDDLDARNVLPLTDGEIKTLNEKALEQFPDLTPKEDTEPASPFWFLLDWLFYVLFIWCVFKDSRIVFLLSMLAGIAVIALAMAGASWVGLASALYPAVSRHSGLRTVDTNDRHVLSAVVRVLTQEPENHFSNVSAKIRLNRNRIASSLESLQKLIDELTVEGAERSDALTILRRSRLEQAERSQEKLERLDGHLAIQLRDAESAIMPIREIGRHFQKMLQISDDLTKIQAAHGLIDETENNLIENRQEIQLLRIASMQALGSLKSIELDIKSKELAEDEVLQLRN